MNRGVEGKFLLEFSCVALGAAVLILSLGDIFILQQSRNAIRVGVNEALRCLTIAGSEDGCSAPGRAQGSLTLPERYDVFGSGYRTPFPVVSAIGRWLEIPKVEITSRRYPGEHVVVEYEQPSYRLGRWAVRFPVSAMGEYLLERSPPVFLAGRSFSPDVRSVRDRARRVDADEKRIAITIPPTVKSGAVDGGNSAQGEYDEEHRIGSITFTVSALDATARTLLRIRGESIPCFQNIADDPLREGVPGGIRPGGRGFEVDWQRREELESCSAGRVSLLQGGRFIVPVAFQVVGAAAVSSPGTEGKLSISAQWRDLGGEIRTRRLGGRVFNRVNTALGVQRGSAEVGETLGASSESGSLVLRGLPRSQIADAVFKEFETEYAAHGAPLLVPDGEPVTLTFYMRKTAGSSATSAAWRGDFVRIFYPEFKGVTQTLYTSDQSLPTQCILSKSHLDERGEGHLAHAIVNKCMLAAGAGPHPVITPDLACVPTPTIPDPSVEKDPEGRIAAIWQRAKDDPASISEEQTFRGVLEECEPIKAQTACDGSGVVEVYDGCEGSDWHPTMGDPCSSRVPANAVNIRLHPRKESEPNRMLYDGCEDLSFLPKCANRHVSLEPRRDAPPHMNTSRCIGVTAQSLSFGPIQYSEPATLEQCQENPSAFMSARAIPPEVSPEALISVSCEAPHWEFIPSKPENPGVPYLPTNKGEMFQIATNVSERYANILCSEREGECQKRALPKRTLAIESRETTTSSALDLEKAREILFAAASTAYPQFLPCIPERVGDRLSCRCGPLSRNCLSMSIEPSLPAGSIRVVASAKIPMGFLSIFDSEIATVRYANTSVLEANLILPKE